MQPVGVADLVDEALAVVGVEVADDDLGTFGEEPQDGGPADAAGPSGDDGDAVCQGIGHGGDARRRRFSPRKAATSGHWSGAEAGEPAEQARQNAR